MDIKEATQQLDNLHKERNQHVINLDKLDVPQAEIARKFKISRQRVNQIIKRANKEG